MVTTAKEAVGTVCLSVLVNYQRCRMDMCLPGECSAWEWDTDKDDGSERLGHCLLAGEAAMPQGGRKRKNKIN